MIRFKRTSSSLVVCLWLVGASTAAAATDGILIYGPEDAGMQEQQQAAALLQASIGEEAVPNSAIHILDLPFPSPDPVWIAGDARVVPCTDPAFESEELPALLAQGVEHIDALDYEEGKRTLDHAITALPCASNPVPRDVLIELYYFRGIAAFHMGDRHGAQQSFQYALAIDKEKTWDTNYPPEPQQVFLLAKEDAIGLGRMDIGHDVAGADIVEFSFDGNPVDPDAAGVLQVIPGMHLVQYTVDGRPYSRLVEVRKEGPAALVTRAGLTEAVMGGPDATGRLPAARASLRALVQGRNLQRAYVVVLDGASGGKVFLYDETYTALQATAAVVVPTRGGGSAGTGKAPAGEYSPGGISLGLGGFAFAHKTAYASFGLRGHVKLYRGLELDAGGGANVKRYQRDGSSWVAVLPYIRLGVRYRFGQSAFRPYVGGALLLNFWGEPPGDDGSTVSHASPGGVFLGGFDVHVSELMYVNLDLNVGYSYAFWVGVQGGIGFRF